MSTSNNEENDPHRISDLPDDLLRLVMSYLTAQEAVQTSVLSRRWQNVWSSMTYLDDEAANFSSMKSFKKFLDNLLLHRSTVPLDTLWICAICNNSDDSLDYSGIHPWVRHALRSNVRNLGVLMHCGSKLLSIDGYPFPFALMHLSMLQLCNFCLDDCFVRKLSSGCPFLKYLELISCAIKVTMFFSTTLKSLIIDTRDTRKNV